MQHFAGFNALQWGVVNEESQSDEALVAALGGGDMQALQTLVLRHQDKAQRLAYRLLGRADYVEDIAQEAFIRVHRHAARFTPQAKFTTWFYRIVVNLCHDHRRKRRAVAVDWSKVDPPTPDATGAAMDQAELAAAVGAAIEKLADRQRAAIVLHRYEGLSHREVAEAMGVSVKSVESLLVRAYANLREHLKDWQPDAAGSGRSGR